ncbi:MAG TPA: glycoside hydrolase family 13 protein [Chitinophagaceae bacterium]|nr:glycoside hydrolase family 13 protein [Chitinophagaceae bacterium]
MRRAAIYFLFLSFALAGRSQPAVQAYPLHWWVGMHDPSLQILLHGNDIGSAQVSLHYPGVRLVKVNRVENKNYLFLDLQLAAGTRPGKLNIDLRGSTGHQTLTYSLKPKSREDGKSRIQGVTSRDFIYLLMPDRFANGDPRNDYFPDMRDTAHSRRNPFDRHGGDLQGVSDHLDYLKDLGVTTIWMTPVVENDMARTVEGGTSRSTYHGYAFTDQYHVDRRLGGNEAYHRLIEAAHQKGLKVIQDAVYNHVGADHWFIRDLPMKDWVNQWPRYTNTSYREEPLLDPYAAQIDRKTTLDGWFTPFMPDLNQKNPYVARFLIQYAIWATEEFGIDGWRVDTYYYSDPDFLNRINNALLAEFPRLTCFGETLVHDRISSAYFTRNRMEVPFKHNCPGVLDFPLTDAMIDALKEPFSWSGGVNRLYHSLALDLVYADPMRNCIFLDNHDLDRIYSVIGEDFGKFQTAMNWLLTMRGIPQLYYGTEILMKNFKNPTDAEVRRDFPGGWKEDSVNKFEPAGRSREEQAAWTYISTLARFRKSSPALTSGKLMQYLPVNGVYVYFRYCDRQTILVATNTGSQDAILDWSRLSERAEGFHRLRNVLTGEIRDMEGFSLKRGESLVLELLK